MSSILFSWIMWNPNIYHHAPYVFAAKQWFCECFLYMCVLYCFVPFGKTVLSYCYANKSLESWIYGTKANIHLLCRFSELNSPWCQPSLTLCVQSWRHCPTHRSHEDPSFDGHAPPISPSSTWVGQSWHIRSHLGRDLQESGSEPSPKATNHTVHYMWTLECISIPNAL